MRRCEMKRIVCRKVWRWALKLRCRNCGKRETFEIKNKEDVPTHWMNGWFVYGTEVCSMCFRSLFQRKET